MAAEKKKEAKKLERTYNIPLRKEFLKVPKWRRTKKAVAAVKQFLAHHMKSEEVKLGKELNEALWVHGIRNPPHHIKVTAIKDEKGEVRAELFGVKKEEKKVEEKKSIKKSSEEESSPVEKEELKKTVEKK